MSAVERTGASTSSLTLAFMLAGEGLPCFPCGADKRPATPRSFKNATCDHDTLRELWRRWPGPLIGVPTGEISGLDILDIDPRHGGGSWFAEHKHRMPITRVHRTRSGGLHLLFQHRPGLRCSAGRIAPGIDVRATGGYAIWWPAAGLPVLCEVPTAIWPNWLSAQSLIPCEGGAVPHHRARRPRDHAAGASGCRRSCRRT